ncbi:hypothetical protein TRFO_32285 [Tritrichomonas foetus]|uniref:Spindle assembly abnormal protein 6 N-terminal domain-containing protein n=1 Tax=Tritrichomonas foetus TaxID=1144522 RepID=A0A1J4JP29_9EUKA|nr:hypothetical protein TRFO_32285 [Tritrichomonas foetus]|eukprot:OHT00903.1 hypothetical protein TRFO_32285 [Tritrichomonas foetus]
MSDSLELLQKLVDSFPRLNANDPSTQDKEHDENGNIVKVRPNGFSCIFNKELNLEFRNFETQESTSRIVNFRILVKIGSSLEQIRFEVMDDADLYYFFEAIFDQELFNEMREKDQLTIDFSEFPLEVINLLQDCQKNDSETQITFVEENDEAKSATMEFLQILELKAVEIFKIRFIPSDPLFVQDQVQYRFDQINKQLAYKKAYLTEFDKQIQSKNPILYKALTKSPRTLRK